MERGWGWSASGTDANQRTSPTATPFTVWTFLAEDNGPDPSEIRPGGHGLRFPIPLPLSLPLLRATHPHAAPCHIGDCWRFVIFPTSSSTFTKKSNLTVSRRCCRSRDTDLDLNRHSTLRFARRPPPSAFEPSSRSLPWRAPSHATVPATSPAVRPPRHCPDRPARNEVSTCSTLST